jgi:hypothetical protein
MGMGRGWRLPDANQPLMQYYRLENVRLFWSARFVAQFMLNVSFVGASSMSADGQLPPLVLAAEPPPERLLYFETSQIANSR